MCLENLVDHPVIAQNSESYYLPDDILEDLKSRYNEIVLFYDNDEPGIKAMEKQAELYKCNFVIMNGKIAKDVSDFYEIDKDSLIEELEEMNLLK